MTFFKGSSIFSRWKGKLMVKFKGIFVQKHEKLLFISSDGHCMSMTSSMTFCTSLKSKFPVLSTQQRHFHTCKQMKTRLLTCWSVHQIFHMKNGTGTPIPAFSHCSLRPLNENYFKSTKALTKVNSYTPFTQQGLVRYQKKIKLHMKSLF